MPFGFLLSFFLYHLAYLYLLITFQNQKSRKIGDQCYVYTYFLKANLFSNLFQNITVISLCTLMIMSSKAQFHKKWDISHLPNNKAQRSCWELNSRLDNNYPSFQGLFSFHLCSLLWYPLPFFLLWYVYKG